MSNEEFERRFNNAMATIVENQARFSEDQDKIKARQDRFDEEMRKMQEAITGLIRVARLHNEAIDELPETGLPKKVYETITFCDCGKEDVAGHSRYDESDDSGICLNREIPESRYRDECT